MRSPELKAALQAGHLVAGPILKFPVEAIVEMVGHSGFDFIIIDREHAAINVTQLESLLRAADAVGIPAIVRIPSLEQEHVQQAVDSGAAGVWLPRVETATAAGNLVQATTIGSAGTLGLGGGVRSTKYGTVPLEEHARSVNEDLIRIVQIETTDGVKNVKEISRVEGIDVVHVGPSDLSASLGIPGKREDKAVGEVVERVVEAAVAAQKVGGTVSSYFNRLTPFGARFVTFSADVEPLRKAFQEMVSSVREHRVNLA